MATPDAGNIFRFLNHDSVNTQPRDKSIIVCASQSRVRLLGRKEVFFNAEVNLYIAAFKPASAAARELCGFRDLAHSENACVKATRSIFFARRHRKLHVVNCGEWSGGSHSLLVHFKAALEAPGRIISLID